jgi:glutamyl-tRNA synthetase
VDGRYAPSPTGPLHLGNLRTAVVAWLFARSQGSRFVLRFEDLDPGPVRDEYYDAQRRDLAALGLDWDDELSQRDHLDRYRDAIAQLDAAGLLYRCYCTRRELAEAAAAPHGPGADGRYPGTCRELSAATVRGYEREGRRSARRVRADGATAHADDVLLGLISSRVEDLVIERTDGVVAYNLAVVVDDAHQGVAQVVRGDDLVHVTPAQRWLGSQLGFGPLSYAHVPLVLGPSGARLAKRDGAVTLADRVALGDGVDDVRRWLLASLGLADLPLAQLAAGFDPARLPRAPWQLDPSDIASAANLTVMNAASPSSTVRSGR